MQPVMILIGAAAVMFCVIGGLSMLAEYLPPQLGHHIRRHLYGSGKIPSQGSLCRQADTGAEYCPQAFGSEGSGRGHRRTPRNATGTGTLHTHVAEPPKLSKRPSHVRL